MKAAKQRKMQRAIVAHKGLRQREAVRITNAQLTLRDANWTTPNSHYWLTLISHWQPIKR